MTELRMGQISDLHFSAGADPNSTKHCHSIDLLVAAEKTLKSLNLDYLVVSGDITNNGDRESLLKAQDWLVREFGIGGRRSTGLKLPAEKLGIVPGNHDAWNSATFGKARLRWQRSVQNYNDVFEDHRIPEEGCYYNWIEKDDLCVFLAFVDSSYLGALEGQGALSDPFSKIARGKLSLDQFETLLQWNDCGLHGKLEKPRQPGNTIPANAFAESLKILVMHHYLFPPSGVADDYFMDLNCRDIVTRNVVMADFDIVLCGHKHIPEFEPKAMGELFDGRARKRYLLNALRRNLGMHSIPLRFPSEMGRRISKAIGFFTHLVRQSQPGSTTDDLVELLSHAIGKPSVFKAELKTMLANAYPTNQNVTDMRELKELQSTVMTRFTTAERKLLSAVIRRNLNEALNRLSQRTLLHIISGSTTKAFHSTSPCRSLNVYTVKKDARHIRFEMEQYSWSFNTLSNTGSFSATTCKSQEFTHDRRV